jgi:hypothetical protein
MIGWNEIFETQRKQGALASTLTNDIAHNKNALGVTEGIVVQSGLFRSISLEF